MARTTLSLLPEPPPDEMRAHARDRVSSVAASRTLLIWSRAFGRSNVSRERKNSITCYLRPHPRRSSIGGLATTIFIFCPSSRAHLSHGVFLFLFRSHLTWSSTSDAACSPATALGRARRILPRSRSWLPRSGSRRACVARGPATVA
jgi:hypothetical protein